MDPFLVPELNLFSVFLLKTLIVYSDAEVLFIYAIRRLPGKNYPLKYTPFGEISKLIKEKKHFFANFSEKPAQKGNIAAINSACWSAAKAFWRNFCDRSGRVWRDFYCKFGVNGCNSL